MLKKFFGVGLLAAFLMAGSMSVALAIECPTGYSQCSIYFDDGSGQLKYIGEGCCSDD